MVQTADVCRGDHLTQRRRLHFTRCRRVAIEGQVWATEVIVVEIIGEDSLQMCFVQCDRVVQTFHVEVNDLPPVMTEHDEDVQGGRAANLYELTLGGCEPAPVGR